MESRICDRKLKKNAQEYNFKPENAYINIQINRYAVKQKNNDDPGEKLNAFHMILLCEGSKLTPDAK